MKIAKDYAYSVCVVFTVLALTKVLMEGIGGRSDPHYIMNFGLLFIITCFATFVLFMHRIFQKTPLLFVIIGQYVVVMGMVLLGIFVTSKFVEIASNAYRDMFLQITIPYIILAGIYYILYFKEIKKANLNLSEIKKLGNDNNSL